jgi:hypothetical protein
VPRMFSCSLTRVRSLTRMCPKNFMLAAPNIKNFFLISVPKHRIFCFLS